MCAVEERFEIVYFKKYISYRFRHEWIKEWVNENEWKWMTEWKGMKEWK